MFDTCDGELGMLAKYLGFPGQQDQMLTFSSEFHKGK